MLNNLSLKKAAIEAIKALPDDCTFEDILNEIRSLGSMVSSFLEVEQGNFLTIDELLYRLKMDKM